MSLIRKLIFTSFCAVTALMGPAYAAEDKARVVLGLMAEGWVTTNSALVNVTIATVPDAKDADKTRERIQKALAELNADATWNMINFNQHEDRTGLLQWHIQAEARLDGVLLSDLPQEIEQLSSPGFQVNLSHIEYRPSQAEYTAAERTLRTQLYAEAEAERQNLMQAYAGSDWRVLAINFTNNNTVQTMSELGLMSAQNDQIYRTRAGVSGKARSAAMPVAQRIMLNAVVTLERRD